MGGFSVYLSRNPFTQDTLRAAGLSERQIKAVLFVQKSGRITNAEYRRLCRIGRVTAFKDLDDLVNKGLLEKIGATGTGVHYIPGRAKPNARNAQSTLAERSAGTANDPNDRQMTGKRPADRSG